MRITGRLPLGRNVWCAADLLVQKAAFNGRASGCSVYCREGGPVQSHELLYGHRPLTGNCGDDLVFAREDAVLIIEGDGAEMLDQELRPVIFFQALAISLDRAWTVGDGATEDAADCLGDALLT